MKALWNVSCGCAVRMWFCTHPIIRIGIVTSTLCRRFAIGKDCRNRPKQKSSTEMPGDCSARHSKDQLSAERRAHMRGRGVATCCSAVLFLCCVGATVSAHAQVEPFYKGKTITIVVGYNPGDAHDLWARAYSRHLGRYIPAIPTSSSEICQVGVP